MLDLTAKTAQHEPEKKNAAGNPGRDAINYSEHNSPHFLFSNSFKSYGVV